MKKMVVGFLFSKDEKIVALIWKKRPEFQAGKLNGIGGNIEPGESPYDAMIREFKEETGTDVRDWKHFCKMTGSEFELECFKAFDDVQLASTTDETVQWVRVSDVVCGSAKVVKDLMWMIPMALDTIDADCRIDELE